MRKKIIIDIEKNYKTRQMVLFDINASKLSSPIILIDPTFPQRNALAALSNETFRKFQKACKNFLNKPSLKAFDIKEIDLEKIKRDAKKKKLEFILIKAITQKQRGDIAGSKLLKFFKHLGTQISRFFDIMHNGFTYDGENSANYYFVVKSKKEILVSGPFTKDKKSVSAFKKRHKKTTIKGNRIYARDKIDFNIKGFVSNWKKKYKNRLKEMSITSLTLKH